MTSIYDLSLARILPESLKADSQFVAIAEALDPLLRQFAHDTKLAMHLPRLDELTGTILDILANQFHVDYYDAVNLDDQQKRNLIRQSIALHRRKGTPWAVEQVTDQFFNQPVVEELDGFLFRINAKEYTATPAAFETFCRMLWDAKPVRSWLEGIYSDISPPPTKIYTRGAILTSGVVNVDTFQTKGSVTRLRAGNVLLTTGSETHDIYKPKSTKTCLKVGCPFMVIGQVLIDSVDRPVLQSVRENPAADLAIANVSIARGDNFVEPFGYDFLRIFFKFPTATSRRSIIINRPREDLTKAQIKAVADYAVTNDLLLNRCGEDVVQAPRANLITKRITKFI